MQTITPAILMMSLAGFLDERNKSSENSLKASLVVVGLVLAIVSKSNLAILLNNLAEF